MRELFDKEGHLSDLGVSHYVDALRTGKVDDLPRELTGHVGECKECKKSVLQLHAVMRDTGPGKSEKYYFFDKPARPQKRIYFSAYRIAAIVAFFVFLAILAFYFIQSTDETIVFDDLPPVVTEEAKPPVAEEEKEEIEIEEKEIDRRLYAANFEPLPLYESMVAQDYRSYGVEVLAPGVGIEIHDGVTFEWEIRYSDPLIVTILNNHGDHIHQNTITETTYRFDNFPEPGLYYWRLETEQRLLYVGKFVVPVK